MATITEDYVSFETAKLLKEKGFDEHCFCINYPLPEGEHYSIILSNLLNNSIIPFTDEYKLCRYKKDFITIPTLQMAMKWLREEKRTSIIIEFDVTKRGYCPYVYQLDYDMDWVVKWRINIPIKYEEAVEIALKYCLENLI